MRPARGVVTAIVLVLLVASCASSARLERELERRRAEALKKIDVAACEARGGKVEPVCMDRMPACVTPYPDAGLRCSDSSACKGKCLLSAPPSGPTATVTGECQKDDDPCGCFIEILDGKVQGEVCFDWGTVIVGRP